MANRKTLRFMTFGNGCQVCVTHRQNSDGYFRKRWANAFEMFHRFIYRAHRGEIPEGHEVDHVCGFRACVNPRHLRVLPKSEHKIITNRSRVLHRNIEGLI